MRRCGLASWHFLSRSWALRQALALVFIETVLGWWFERETVHVGLLSPSGQPHYAVLALGALYLVTRIATRFLVPAFLAYLFVERLASALLRLGHMAGRG